MDREIYIADLVLGFGLFYFSLVYFNFNTFAPNIIKLIEKSNFVLDITRSCEVNLYVELMGRDGRNQSRTWEPFCIIRKCATKASNVLHSFWKQESMFRLKIKILNSVERIYFFFMREEQLNQCQLKIQSLSYHCTNIMSLNLSR